MRERLTGMSLTLFLFGAFSGAMAAQNHGEDRPNATTRDPVLLEGTVGSIDMGIGEKFPSFTLVLEDSSVVTVITGPYYILLENEFEIGVGDEMSVQAFLSAQSEPAYAAISLVNNTTGDELVIRDDDGTPLWTGEGPQGSVCCPERDLVSLEGTVASLNMTPGERFPTFVLDEAGGVQVTVVASPYYEIIQSGFEINAGDQLKVIAFASLQMENTFVAVELDNLTTGDSIVLLHENDRPRRPRFMRGDANGSGGVDIADAVASLHGLFRAGPLPRCLDTADVNDDGNLDVCDPVFTLLHLFTGGRSIPPPFPDRGVDATIDRLPCE